MRRFMILTAALLAMVAIGPVAAAGVPQERGQKLDRALQQAQAQGDQGELRVIIQTTPAARGALHEKLRGRGARIHTDHPAVSAVAATVTAADLGRAGRRPDGPRHLGRRGRAELPGDEGDPKWHGDDEHSDDDHHHADDHRKEGRQDDE